jgi:hypothetical protein
LQVPRSLPGPIIITTIITITTTRKRRFSALPFRSAQNAALVSLFLIAFPPAVKAC